MDKAEIINFLKEHESELRDRFGIQKIALFGSYAKETAHDMSDIDIAIETKEKDFFIRDDVREYLEEHFRKSVDVGYLDGFREFYKQKIKKDLIYAY